MQALKDAGNSRAFFCFYQKGPRIFNVQPLAEKGSIGHLMKAQPTQANMSETHDLNGELCRSLGMEVWWTSAF